MAANPRDIVDIDGFREDPSDDSAPGKQNKETSDTTKFLSVHFQGNAKDVCCTLFVERLAASLADS